MKKRTLSVAPLKALLERVYLYGTITECLLHVTNGRGHVIALDLTNTVLLEVHEELPGLEDGQYGIGKLDTLVKFLTLCVGEELNYTIDDKWLTLRRKGHGKFSILLLEPGLVGTQTENDPEINKNIKDNYKIHIPISQGSVNDANAYIGLISGQLVSFHLTESGQILFSNATTNEVERFETPFGKVEGKVVEEFQVAVYSQQLSRVFEALTIPEGKTATLFLAKDRPVIIRQDLTNVWCLTNSAV